MKEFVEKYCPVRQRTVREETTKNKAGALLPPVYTRQQDFNKVDLMVGLGSDFNAEDPVGPTSEEEKEEKEEEEDQQQQQQQRQQQQQQQQQ